jgi:histidine triad (HIT) family protein
MQKHFQAKNRIAQPDCTSCKIITGPLPSHLIYEDSHSIAILSIDPLTDGHTLVIPKNHTPKFWQMEDDEEYINLMLTARKVAQALNKTFHPEHILELAEGLDINHVHIHIIPAQKSYSELANEHKSTVPNHAKLARFTKDILKI